MMTNDKIGGIVESVLGKEEKLFLVDLTVSPDLSVKVVLDGDTDVSLSDCVRISRTLEQQFDDEDFDFSLEVTTAGATAPLTLPRQFPKHVGRKLKVRTGAEVIQGELTAATADDITLVWKVREPKPVGKGKVTVQKEKHIPLTEIEEAKVVLKF